jgi:hypothetical protein
MGIYLPSFRARSHHGISPIPVNKSDCIIGAVIVRVSNVSNTLVVVIIIRSTVLAKSARKALAPGHAKLRSPAIDNKRIYAHFCGRNALNG